CRRAHSCQLVYRCAAVQRRKSLTRRGSLHCCIQSKPAGARFPWPTGCADQAPGRLRCVHSRKAPPCRRSRAFVNSCRGDRMLQQQMTTASGELQPTGGSPAMQVAYDEAPTTRFHALVAVGAAGGQFSDGYILGTIGIALSLATETLHLNA